VIGRPFERGQQNGSNAASEQGRPTRVLNSATLVYEIELTHSLDAAHRVVGHEGGKGKCARLHGHTYTFHVRLRGGALDPTGFVVDYGVVKRELDAWDHRTLLWERDHLTIDNSPENERLYGVIRVEFNPTAENMARFWAERFAALESVEQATVTVQETPKSRATFTAGRAAT
jgi:6-pyruvoyltetrahydropterin/6-carboxytetrahydropterin synthase